MSFNNNLINIISNQLAINLTEFSFFNKLAIFSIFSLPIFHLTFNDWTGYWVVLSSLFCLISIIQDKVSLKIVLSDNLVLGLKPEPKQGTRGAENKKKYRLRSTGCRSYLVKT